MTKTFDYYHVVKPYWIINILGMLFITAIVWKPESVPLEKLSYLGILAKYLYYEFTTLFIAGVYIAWASHILEALYAVNLTNSLSYMSVKCKLFWFIQTFLIGYPSLRLLKSYLSSKII